jgi:sugar O-acyltransferase (sialic acid O-acetyltransferase NeuD family)
MTQPIAIFGSGGFAREVLQVVLDINAHYAAAPPWKPVGFVVDTAYAIDQSVHDFPVYSGLDWLRNNSDVMVVIGVGSSAARQKIATRIRANCTNPWATLIHPQAWLGRRVEIGLGAVICAGGLITTDIRIGAHVHINLGCTIGHDAVLDDFVTLNPGVNVSGATMLGTGCEIGTGAVVLPSIKVGEWAIVGAGAVVNKPLAANVTAVGVPACVVKKRSVGWQNLST